MRPSFPVEGGCPCGGCPLPTGRRSFGTSRLSLHGLPAGQWFSICDDDVRSATGDRGRAGEARDSLVRDRRGVSETRRTLRGLLRAPLESEHSVPGNRRDSPGHFRRYELARTDRPSMDDSRSTVRSDPERRASHRSEPSRRSRSRSGVEGNGIPFMTRGAFTSKFGASRRAAFKEYVEMNQSH